MRKGNGRLFFISTLSLSSSSLSSLLFSSLAFKSLGGRGEKVDEGRGFRGGYQQVALVSSSEVTMLDSS